MAIATTGLPALAQTVAVAWSADKSNPAIPGATHVPAVAVAATPVPPADVPAAAPSNTEAQAPTIAADGTVPDATPVAPDTKVAAAPLPKPPDATATAADAALNMANMMDGAGGGISNADLMSALENAAAAGQPMALWRLGTMYENGEGVEKDDVKAFGYFSQIANDHADAAPKGVDADIVAQSFVKMGDYYKQGLPDAGIAVDPERAEQLILHAATYFGNADAQYRVGEIYLDTPHDNNPLQGARWLSLAAHKGHVAAQAKLGDMLFNGAGIKAQPAEGLMWLTVAHERSVGTPDEDWVNELLTRDMSVATAQQREDAVKMADAIEAQFSPPGDTASGE
jgi:TPR repeat protein